MRRADREGGGTSLLGRHEALQFFSAIQQDIDRGRCRILLRALLHHQKASSIGRHGGQKLPSARLVPRGGPPTALPAKRAIDLAEGASPVARPARGLHRKQPTSPRE